MDFSGCRYSHLFKNFPVCCDTHTLSLNFKLCFSFLEVFNIIIFFRKLYWGFPDGSLVKNLSANKGDMGSVCGWGRSPGGGNGNRFQYSCLGNPLDRGAWRATVHVVIKLQTWLSVHSKGTKDLPGGSVVKNTCHWMKWGFNLWVGKTHWRRKWQPLQYSCLGNPLDREAWLATVHGVTKHSDMTQHLNNKGNKIFPFVTKIPEFFPLTDTKVTQNNHEIWVVSRRFYLDVGDM